MPFSHFGVTLESLCLFKRNRVFSHFGVTFNYWAYKASWLDMPTLSLFPNNVQHPPDPVRIWLDWARIRLDLTGFIYPLGMTPQTSKTTIANYELAKTVLWDVRVPIEHP